MSDRILCIHDWQFSRDGKNFERVSLPHAAYIEPDEITDPQIGTVYYRYTFFAPEEWQKKIVYFEIGAAMQRAEIRVNGEYHFTHFGGYQKFFIPLSDDLKFNEENTIDIALYNGESRDMPPGKKIKTLDFCYHSGLQRDAALVVYEPVHITDPLAVAVTAGGGAFIRTESVTDDGSAALDISCHVLHEFPATRRFELWTVANSKNTVDVALEILSPDGKSVYETRSNPADLRPNCDETFHFNVTLPGAELWSIESPRRYTAVFRVYHNGILTDTMEEKFGIRTIRFDRTGFYLNEKKVFLNGTNRHMEYPFVGNSVPANGQKRDALLIQQGGHNFVRLSHYNQDPAFLEACDELGLLVMPAIPGWQAYHANSAFFENAFRDCRELIRSLRNRPCVILWEVSLNEAYPPGWINEEFHRIAHEEYPGKFCYSAGDTWGFYEGWDVLFSCDHIRDKSKPVLVREYGDWCFGGGNSTSRRARGDAPGELMTQAWNFLWTLNRLYAVPNVVGGADWCFLDYNRGCSNQIERSGSLDLYRLPKPKYFFYRSQGVQEKMLYAFQDPAVSKLVVFSNCDEVELNLNGTVIARQKPDSGEDTPYGKNGSPGWETALPDGFDLTGGVSFNGGNGKNLAHPPFTFFNINELGADDVLTVSGYADGAKCAEQILRKAGEIAEVETRIRTEGVEIVPGDLVFVDAILKDAAGTVVPAAKKVKLIASGDAEIIGGMAETEAGIASWFVKFGSGEYSLKAELV